MSELRQIAADIAKGSFLLLDCGVCGCVRSVPAVAAITPHGTLIAVDIDDARRQWEREHGRCHGEENAVALELEAERLVGTILVDLHDRLFRLERVLYTTIAGDWRTSGRPSGILLRSDSSGREEIRPLANLAHGFYVAPDETVARIRKRRDG